MLFLRVIAWYGAEKISLKKSCFYLYIRRATVIGQIASGCLVIVYFVRFKKMGLTAEMLKPRGMYIKGILTLWRRC